ncbi:MAG: sensor domain-containing diguanylate cyclase [Deltaproteobacteria bacterium]|nr:sensor domain-containing diguanylate cyclase [Deltaproteobacteria bacterium]
MRINLAKNLIIERVLERKQWTEQRGSQEVDLGVILKSILKWANEFVPSESGSIFLDEPIPGNGRAKKRRLYFIACYGTGSAKLTGTTLPSDVGIVGKCYSSGKPCMSKNVANDKNFYGNIDKKTKYQSQSIICVPIKIKNYTVGVIELINRVGKINFTKSDLTLLEIFAGYTSTLIQNTLDAKKLGELSMKDSLTGLYNDRFFLNKLPQEIKKAINNRTDLGVVFLDLDRFKGINDSHGHLVGSQLLSELGALILSLINQSNSYAVRYGGDEFTVILPGYDMEKSRVFAEKLRKEIEGFVFIDKAVPGVVKALKIKGIITASIGVATLKTNIKENSKPKQMREGLIKAADLAMYSSKLAGKNFVTVAPPIRKSKVK